MISRNKKRGQVATLRWDEQWKISLIGSEKAVRTEVDFVGPLSTLTLKCFMTHESSRAATDELLDNACWSLSLSSEFIQCDSWGNISGEDSRCLISFLSLTFHCEKKNLKKTAAGRPATERPGSISSVWLRLVLLFCRVYSRLVSVPT